MDKPRILHIAPINTAGVPGELVKAERRLGYDSRLVTLFKDKRNYYEDICLNLPMVDHSWVRRIKRLVSDPKKLHISNKITLPEKIPIKWKPHTIFEAMLVAYRDFLWTIPIFLIARSNRFCQYDVFQLDGGLGFFRSSKFIKMMKKRGKKIICCYTGSDLRTRGVIPKIDQMSDLNVTVEFDHLQFHPNIHHVPFPFNAEEFELKNNNSDKIRIGHAPTNWDAKGSHIIVPVLKKMVAENPNLELVLIQNMSYSSAIETKKSCDIFIDQIGDLGYGINSLEALAMGIPTLTCLAQGFEDQYPDHPFIQIDENNLEEKLQHLINDKDLREKIGLGGREWVITNHNSFNVVKKIHQLAEIGDNPT